MMLGVRNNKGMPNGPCQEKSYQNNIRAPF
jgi:hypothetical protein